MATTKTFGRRPGAAPPPTRRKAEPTCLAPSAIIVKQVRPQTVPPPVEPATVDAELRDWKRTRPLAMRIPWRQLSLMAGLCFTIASLVLPASVNDAVQYPLYALTAASVWAGLHRRRQARQTADETPRT